MTNTGGPAFPFSPSDDSTIKPQLGMTLRDYFAAQAMNALILEMADWKYAPEALAKYAYAQADAMLKVRGTP
jgi:hypothetical protein